jgi:hypothetical protein
VLTKAQSQVVLGSEMGGFWMSISK